MEFDSDLTRATEHRVRTNEGLELKNDFAQFFEVIVRGIPVEPEVA